MLEVKFKNSILNAKIDGEIDHSTAITIRTKIDAAIHMYRPKLLELDFSSVTFMDSSGIAVVINALRNMSRIEGKLLLTGLSNQPMKVFRASGIDKLVEIKDAVS